MSKYIIELDDRIKLVTSVGVTENGVVYTTSDYVHNLEELNSDYINEHFGELQDEAYQRGINDGSLDVKQNVLHVVWYFDNVFHALLLRFDYCLYLFQFRLEYLHAIAIPETVYHLVDVY